MKMEFLIIIILSNFKKNHEFILLSRNYSFEDSLGLKLDFLKFFLPTFKIGRSEMLHFKLN